MEKLGIKLILIVMQKQKIVIFNQFNQNEFHNTKKKILYYYFLIFAQNLFHLYQLLSK